MVSPPELRPAWDALKEIIEKAFPDLPALQNDQVHAALDRYELLAWFRLTRDYEVAYYRKYNKRFLDGWVQSYLGKQPSWCADIQATLPQPKYPTFGIIKMRGPEPYEYNRKEWVPRSMREKNPAPRQVASDGITPVITDPRYVGQFPITSEQRYYHYQDPETLLYYYCAADIPPPWAAREHLFPSSMFKDHPPVVYPHKWNGSPIPRLIPVKWTPETNVEHFLDYTDGSDTIFHLNAHDQYVNGSVVAYLGDIDYPTISEYMTTQFMEPRPAYNPRGLNPPPSRFRGPKPGPFAPQLPQRHWPRPKTNAFALYDLGENYQLNLRTGDWDLVKPLTPNPNVIRLVNATDTPIQLRSKPTDFATIGTTVNLYPYEGTGEIPQCEMKPDYRATQTANHNKEPPNMQPPYPQGQPPMGWQQPPNMNYMQPPPQHMVPPHMQQPMQPMGSPVPQPQPAAPQGPRPYQPPQSQPPMITLPDGRRQTIDPKTGKTIYYPPELPGGKPPQPSPEIVAQMKHEHMLKCQETNWMTPAQSTAHHQLTPREFSLGPLSPRDQHILATRGLFATGGISMTPQQQMFNQPPPTQPVWQQPPPMGYMQPPQQQVAPQWQQPQPPQPLYPPRQQSTCWTQQPAMQQQPPMGYPQPGMMPPQHMVPPHMQQPMVPPHMQQPMQQPQWPQPGYPQYSPYPQPPQYPQYPQQQRYMPMWGQQQPHNMQPMQPRSMFSMENALTPSMRSTWQPPVTPPPENRPLPTPTILEDAPMYDSKGRKLEGYTPNGTPVYKEVPPEERPQMEAQQPPTIPGYEGHPPHLMGKPIISKPVPQYWQDMTPPPPSQDYDFMHHDEADVLVDNRTGQPVPEHRQPYPLQSSGNPRLDEQRRREIQQQQERDEFLIAQQGAQTGPDAVPMDYDLEAENRANNPNMPDFLNMGAKAATMAAPHIVGQNEDVNITIPPHSVVDCPMVGATSYRSPELSSLPKVGDAPPAWNPGSQAPQQPQAQQAPAQPQPQPTAPQQSGQREARPCPSFLVPDEKRKPAPQPKPEPVKAPATPPTGTIDPLPTVRYWTGNEDDRVWPRWLPETEEIKAFRARHPEYDDMVIYPNTDSILKPEGLIGWVKELRDPIKPVVWTDNLKELFLKIAVRQETKDGHVWYHPCYNSCHRFGMQLAADRQDLVPSVAFDGHPIVYADAYVTYMVTLTGSLIAYNRQKRDEGKPTTLDTGGIVYRLPPKPGPMSGVVWNHPYGEMHKSHKAYYAGLVPDVACYLLDFSALTDDMLDDSVSIDDAEKMANAIKDAGGWFNEQQLFTSPRHDAARNAQEHDHLRGYNTYLRKAYHLVNDEGEVYDAIVKRHIQGDDVNLEDHITNAVTIADPKANDLMQRIINRMDTTIKPKLDALTDAQQRELEARAGKSDKHRAARDALAALREEQTMYTLNARDLEIQLRRARLTAPEYVKLKEDLELNQAQLEEVGTLTLDKAERASKLDALRREGDALERSIRDYLADDVDNFRELLKQYHTVHMLPQYIGVDAEGSLAFAAREISTLPMVDLDTFALNMPTALATLPPELVAVYTQRLTAYFNHYLQNVLSMDWFIEDFFNDYADARKELVLEFGEASAVERLTNEWVNFKAFAYTLPVVATTLPQGTLPDHLYHDDVVVWLTGDSSYTLDLSERDLEGYLDILGRPTTVVYRDASDSFSELLWDIVALSNAMSPSGRGVIRIQTARGERFLTRDKGYDNADRVVISKTNDLANWMNAVSK